jgi:ubiquinone biosynthesis protein UbiJ
MATQSPFSWLADAADTLRSKLPSDLPEALKPPAWAVREMQQRVVLFLNHVLMQEPAARDRLQRQKGRQVQLCWRDQVFCCAFTPAGLLEFVAMPDSANASNTDAASSTTKAPDLVLRVNEPSPFEIARTVLQGDKPAIRIEGDVQLAAEVNWLIDHVRWDPEEDLARLIGDAPAHTLAQTARRVADVLRQFATQRSAQKAAP